MNYITRMLLYFYSCSYISGYNYFYVLYIFVSCVSQDITLHDRGSYSNYHFRTQKNEIIISQTLIMDQLIYFKKLNNNLQRLQWL